SRTAPLIVIPRPVEKSRLQFQSGASTPLRRARIERAEDCVHGTAPSYARRARASPHRCDKQESAAWYRFVPTTLLYFSLSRRKHDRTARAARGPCRVAERSAHSMSKRFPNTTTLRL